MSNAFDDVRAAVDAAKMQLRAADTVATNMAYLLRGRLRKVDAGYILKDLKKELANFNAQTGQWKD
jgi:hypothetical protein